MTSTDEWKGARFKEAEDHSQETNVLLERINATTIPDLLKSSGKTIDELVDEILVLEKKCRLGDDVASTRRLAVEALRICRVQKDVVKMLSLLDTLMKKRAQTKQVQVAMIAESAVVLHDDSLEPEKEEDVLERLAHVTDNKIHVELEHARFTVELAKRHEARGMKRSACDMLSALHVETITNMPRLEKLEALNRQIRLCLELEDYEHTPLVSRKINHTALRREEAMEQKLVYFSLMRQYYAKKGSYFNLGRCWYETYLTLTDAKQKLGALSNMMVHYLISEHSTVKEIEDMAECTAFSPATKMQDRVLALSEISQTLKSNLEDLPNLHFLLKQFNSIDVIRERIKREVDDICGTHPELKDYPERQELLLNRCSEHDLIVISRFYTRIRLTRLSELVGLSQSHTESFIMSMVSNKTLYAKIDRVDGLVVFEPPQNTIEVMASWNAAVERSVALLDKASHLITKERMLHNLPQYTAS
ncbi:unnamed protein product [Phytomonas sp. Hart1]|nr:unnamed protein product [Phytomonas sp. Hart1]|eukprot:CCW70290.1 unnamed protein product [Phytomonas sp. isolate Hart1]